MTFYSRRTAFALFAFAALICGLQVLKGLSLEPSPYPLLLTLFSFFDGPVRRSLLPTAYKLLGITTLDSSARAIAVVHFVMTAGLVVALLGLFWQRLSEGKNGLGRLLLLSLLIASPVLPLVGALNGYGDPFLLLGLIGMNALLERGKVITAALLVLCLMLIHELLLVLALPLWLYHIFYPLQPAWRRRLLAGLCVTYIIAAGFIVVSAQIQPALLPVAEARCAAERPEHNRLVAIWDRYCTVQMEGTLANHFAPARVIVLPVYWLAYGFFPLALFLVWYGQASRIGWREGLPLLILMMMPYGMVAIAWDLDRLIVLCSVLGFLIIDRSLARAPAPLPTRPLIAICLLFGTFQLAMSYPAIDVYGQARVISPQTERAYLIDPRSWTLPVIEKAGLFTPPFLDPKTCIDPRC